jgi:hypothetical protein
MQTVAQGHIFCVIVCKDGGELLCFERKHFGKQSAHPIDGTLGVHLMKYHPHHH